MKLTSESKFFIGVALLTAGIVAAGILLFSKPTPQASQTPALPREELITSTTATKGNKDASVYLVEFSDFQCPACAAFKPTVDALVEQYSDRLLFAYRHFPLAQHQFGMAAAQAAEAAGKQGKFWEMYGLLFDNQAELSDEKSKQLAESLGLNMEQYQQDFGAVKDQVLADQSYGLKIGVNATPTFYLNGQKLTLLNPTDLKTKVEAALQ